MHIEKGSEQASVEPLLSYFDQLISLTKEEKELVASKFLPRLFRKRQYVLQEGDICTQSYFVVRGCLRMYKIDEKGRELCRKLIFDERKYEEVAA